MIYLFIEKKDNVGYFLKIIIVSKYQTSNFLKKNKSIASRKQPQCFSFLLYFYKTLIVKWKEKIEFKWLNLKILINEYY